MWMTMLVDNSLMGGEKGACNGRLTPTKKSPSFRSPASSGGPAIPPVTGLKPITRVKVVLEFDVVPSLTLIPRLWRGERGEGRREERKRVK